VEVNQYKAQGLETIAEPMAKLFIWTMNTALGDKQHRVRGMAASYLGILKHTESIPLLIRFLEDDHAHVRACAALALGRMRAQEAKEKLEETMKDDWDQTVRSRSREALERIR
jgi:HEAT repeat protein